MSDRMSRRDHVLARLSGDRPTGPLFLPDLTLWHRWHAQHGTLPAGCVSPAATARSMGVPAWVQIKPWRTQYAGATWATEETTSTRIVRFETAKGVLRSCWTVGPDGDWWQTEYPVKTAEDLAVALEVVKARVYVLDDDGLAEARRAVGQDGVVALELPMTPYSDVLHTLVGWGDGLALLLSERAIADEIVATLDDKLHPLVAALAALPGDILLAPDNLDGQYISPRTYRSYLAATYRRTADCAHRHGRPLVVHVGGPARKLIPLLAESGVDAVEGIAGPPQSDVSLAEARSLAGPHLALWGGLPQDFLTEEWDETAFEAALQNALQESSSDPRAILGVADRVPANAKLDRLARMAAAARDAA